MEQTIRQQTADIPAGNYLFLRCSGDEAAAGLSASQLVAWLGMKASRLPELIMRPLSSIDGSRLSITNVVQVFALLGVYFAVVGLITFGWFITVKFCAVKYFFSPKGPFVERLGEVQSLWQKPQTLNLNETILTLSYMFEIARDLLAVVVLCALVLCVLSVLVIVVTQAVTSWFFGWTRLSTGFVVELAIEPLPFGEHSLIHVDWGAGSIGLEGMEHSRIYAHPTAIMYLQNWVRESLGKMPVTAAEPTTTPSRAPGRSGSK